MKENTRGWWLSKLREPLRTMALTKSPALNSPCDSMVDAVVLLYLNEEKGLYFWFAVHEYFSDNPIEVDFPTFKEGWKMAQECGPRNTKKFQWTDDNVMDFVNWFLKVKNIDQRYEIENIDILKSYKNGDQPEIWHTK